MKKIVCLLVLTLSLSATAAFADVPLVVVKGVDELGQLPKGLDLGPVEVVETAPVSALDPERGIVPLLQLTPKTAEQRWGKPKETYDTGNGKGYTWTNGYSLEYTKAGKLRRVLYWLPQDVAVPFGLDAAARWGFAPAKPDFEGPQVIRWQNKTGALKGLTLEARTVAGQKQLGTFQITLNP